MIKLTNEELEIYRDISIHNLLGINNNGRKIMIRCPFHNDNTPSCVINTNNSFYCFGCGIKGNGAIDFCMRNGYTFQEALEELNNYI